MLPPLSDTPTDDLPPASDTPPPVEHDYHPAAQRRNFSVVAVFQIVMRTGWIFKTESIIMPAVLDTLGGGGWLRGCLPLLSRFGQSVPPLLFARRLKLMPRKKWATAAFTLGMSAAFVLMGLMWIPGWGLSDRAMQIGFLLLYAGFFMCHGLHQLGLSTIQGKLIRPNVRGRLLLTANLLGAAVAVACAAVLMPHWLSADGGQFHLLFGFAGFCFGVSALSTLLLSEPADHYDAPPMRLAEHFLDVAHILRGDRNFRRLALVTMLFATSVYLFPHYQRLGRDQLHLDLTHLVKWVIIQNVGTALFSLVLGPLADWRGNRLVLRITLAGIGLLPLAAVALSHGGPAARPYYGLLFMTIGLTPITIKTLYNYTLECVDQSEHPRYISTLSLCAAAPLMASPVVGWLVDTIGFDVVFVAVSVAVFAGWTLTYRLAEPRHRRPPTTEVPAVSADD